MNRELLQLVDRFQNTPILVVGDLILDHYIWGKVNRISPEAPVVVVRVTEEEKRLGGACNVAGNLLALGAKVFIAGVIGEDEGGRDLRALLERDGADTSGLISHASRQTSVKTRVIAHNQQVVRVDREVTATINDEICEQLSGPIRSAMPNVSGVIVSDYAKGTVCSKIFSTLREFPLGASGKALLVDPKAPNFPLYQGATVIKPNRSEAEEASGMEIPDRKAAAEAGARLLQKWGCEMVLITLGEDGMVLVSTHPGHEPVIEIETRAREVYDVSGAGDTVSAVFSLALAVGGTPRQAAELANFAAGIVVAEVGTVAVSAEKLRAVLETGERL